jgi:hypothetical protein
VRKDILLERARSDQKALEAIVKLKWNGCNKRAEKACVQNALNWDDFL